MASAKLTPAAVTRIRISRGPGTGTGASVTRRMSCGPVSDGCSRARMTAGTLLVGVLTGIGLRSPGAVGTDHLNAALPPPYARRPHRSLVAADEQQAAQRHRPRGPGGEHAQARPGADRE